MRFDYFDMLSGEPVYLRGVGHLRSPLLHELRPASGIGYGAYNLYLNFLSWDKEHLLKYGQIMQLKNVSMLNRDSFNTFDVTTLLAQTRELCRGVLSFFMTEDLIWDGENRRYVSVTLGDNGEPEVIGEINRENFEDVRRAMLQLNFVGLDKDDVPVAHSTDRAKELWEMTQKFIKEQAESTSKDDKPEYHLSNIISKICAIHPSYNLLNIYGLTVFQLYDSFFQLSYMRGTSLSERIFSNHGGKNFNFEDWLKPIMKNV